MRRSDFFVVIAVLMSFPFFSELKASGTYGLKRAELEFHVGPAIPLGSFAKPAFSFYDESGQERRLDYHGARLGVNYGLSFGYYISPDWGVLLLFNGHANKVNPDPFSIYRPDPFEWQTETSDKWTEFMAMAGATYRVRIVDRLVFSLRAYIGYAHLISPFYSSTAMVSNSKYSFKLNSGSDPNFGYGAGAALKFLVSRGFHLDLRCEYMGVVPFKFENVGSEVRMENTGGGQQSVLMSPVFSFKENFQMLNVSLGFTASF